MINTDSLFLTASNESITPSTELITEELSLNQQLLTDKDELPADSFVILLAHTCSEAELASAVEVLEVKTNSTAETAPEISDSIEPEDVEPEPFLSNISALQDNIALNWINLQSYQPPQSYESERLQDDIINTAQVLSMHDVDETHTDQPGGMFFTNPKAGFSANTDTITAHDQYDPELHSDDTMQQFQADKNAEVLSKNLLTTGSNTDTKTETVAVMLQNTESTQYDKILSDFVRIDASTVAQIVQGPSESSSNKAPVPLFDIPQPVDNEQWVDMFSEHIVWFNQQGIKSALIKITPDDLGPLEINIKVVKDLTSVDIVSHSIQAKEILEQALPRLKDMMSVQGLDLAEVTIETDSNPQRSSKNTQEREVPTEPAALQPSAEEVTPLTRRQTQGIVDYFA